MAASPGRQHFVDTNNQKIIVVVQMITHLKQAGAERTEVFFVGGNSVVVQGAIDEIFRRLWP
jgi:UDP-N-acetyl-D-mannosaminuronic acid transferase (WecB/TagA/CpsF family)